MRTWLATALFVTAVGCAAEPPGAEGEPTIDSRVTILPELTGMVVEADSVRIPRENNGSLAALRAGDIIVSTVDEGFLRKIVSVVVTADEFMLATTDAELTDALIDADIATSVGGAGKADTYQLPTIGFSLQNKKILDNAAIRATLVNGSLTFSPELDLDLTIADRSVQNFDMVMRGRVTGLLDLDVDASAADVGPELILWTSPPAVFYQQIGPLPVVETSPPPSSSSSKQRRAVTVAFAFTPTLSPRWRPASATPPLTAGMASVMPRSPPTARFPKRASPSIRSA